MRNISFKRAPPVCWNLIPLGVTRVFTFGRACESLANQGNFVQNLVFLLFFFPEWKWSEEHNDKRRPQMADSLNYSCLNSTCTQSTDKTDCNHTNGRKQVYESGKWNLQDLDSNGRKYSEAVRFVLNKWYYKKTKQNNKKKHNEFHGNFNPHMLL